MSLQKQFEELVRKSQLFSKHDTLLIAVSGGVDSVVLCDLCHQAGYPFIIVHCNFQLRGDESERDQQFVESLVARYGVPLRVKRFDTEAYANSNKIAIQEAARDLRYTWFKELYDEYQSATPKVAGNSERINENAKPGKQTLLLTAHHRGDNIETVLMNIFRGTGLKGMTGIPVKRDFIRRPLLDFAKDELIKYAQSNNLPFVEDSSNATSEYSRNFIRNKIIPDIANLYPQVSENIAANIDRFKEVNDLYNTLLDELLKKICRVKRSETYIPVKKLMGYKNSALIYGLISRFGFSEKQVEEVIKLSESSSGRYILSPGNKFRMIRHKNWFIISPLQQNGIQHLVVEENDDQVIFDGGIISITKLNNISPILSDPAIALLDMREISFPLLLRKWQTGDYFYPLGMKKKKKVARFFIDQKLTAHARENTWIIETGKRIAWVIGKRIDERFKVTERTNEVLRLTLKKTD